MQKQIKAIEQLDIFVTEKVELLLLLFDEKEAAGIYLYSDIYTDTAKPKSVDNILLKHITETLDGLSLVYTVNPAWTDTLYDTHTMTPRYRQAITIQITKDANTMQELIDSENNRNNSALGRLYGFPETAITAYANDDLLDLDTLPGKVKESPDFLFARFGLSKSNWKKEIETGERWAKIIKQNSLDVYEEYLNELKSLGL